MVRASRSRRQRWRDVVAAQMMIVWSVRTVKLMTAVLCVITLLLSVGLTFAVHQSVDQSGVQVSGAEYLLLLVTKSPFLTLIPAVVASTMIGADYRYGLIVNSLLYCPDRSRLLVARFAVLAGVGVLMGISALVVSGGVFLATVSWVAASTVGVSTWLGLLGQVIVVCGGAAILGAAAATLVEARTLAVALTLLLPLFVEPAVKSAAAASGVEVLANLAQLLPFAAGSNMTLVSVNGQSALLAAPGSHPTALVSGLVFLGWVLVASLASWRRFLSRSGFQLA